MNVKKISLALGTLALVSTGAANAAGVVVSDTACGSVITAPAVMENTVLSYPATYTGAPVCARRGLFGTGLFSGLFARRAPLFEVNALGAGIEIGDRGAILTAPRLLRSSAVIEGCGVKTLPAVISSPCGGAVGLNGTRVGNPVFDVQLFNFGVRAGVVNPRYDMRPAGL